MKPIIFFDLETTGTDTVKDKIVQIAAVKMASTLLQVLEQKEGLVNPKRKIPAEATAVHKITDEMVADKPEFGAYAKSLYEFFKDCDVAGFNILRFDVPLLSEEFARCGITWPDADTKFIDCHTLFAEREKRDLAKAVEFYTGTTHTEAHDALGDVRATIKVFHGQLERYPDLAAKSVEGIAAECWGNRVDLAGKIVRDEGGEIVYGFGKDKGKSIKDNQGFALWMLKNDFATETKQVLRKILGHSKPLF